MRNENAESPWRAGSTGTLWHARRLLFLTKRVRPGRGLVKQGTRGGRGAQGADRLSCFFACGSFARTYVRTYNIITYLYKYKYTYRYAHVENTDIISASLPFLSFCSPSVPAQYTCPPVSLVHVSIRQQPRRAMQSNARNHLFWGDHAVIWRP